MSGQPFRRACLVHGCPRPVHSRGRCLVHARQADEARGLDSDRRYLALYRSPEWRALRAAMLEARPWCECPACVAGPRRELATVVHHVQPHGGDRRRFFDPLNLQPLSKACHDRLTGASRGGGRPKVAGPAARGPRPSLARAAGGSAPGGIPAKGAGRG